MKRTAARLPSGSERRRKRTPMRSIGAPVMRAAEAYPNSTDSDLDDAVVRQSLPPPRQPLQPFAPTHPAHPNGNGALVGNGSVHVNGHLHNVGATNATANGFANGSLKGIGNGSSSGVANGIGNTVPNGVGDTIVIDVDALPSPAALTPSRPAADMNGTFVRKPRPSKTAAPISPAARWEAKMEARQSVAGPSSRPGLSTKSTPSKGAGTSNAVSAGQTTPKPALQPNGPVPVVKKKKKRVRKKKLPPPPDPDVPYPKFSENFENIPKEAVGDMLQIYDFCIAFSKTLALSSFSLRTLELALSVQERNPLIDAIVVRLVRTILDDKVASAELDLSATAIGNLKSGKSADAAEKIFKELPYFFSFDEDEDSDGYVDESLRDVFLKMRSSPQTWSLYEVLTPTERLRVLRELVDRAASTEEVRSCVINSIEFEEEERKKAREEIFAQRRAAETQLRELRAELLAFREKHGLLPSAIAAAAAEAKAKEEAEKAAAAAAASKAKKSKKKSKSKSGKAAPPKMPTRKELIMAAQKERAEASKKKAIEREEDNLVQKIEKVKANIKTIKARSAKPGATKKESSDGEEISVEEKAAIAAAAEAEVHLDRAERNEDDPVRMHALGTDRAHRRYWYFAGGGRLWIEHSSTNSWMHAEEPGLLEGLLAWCSPHRKPERALKTVLDKKKAEIEEGMKALAKMKDKEHASRERIKKAPRTRAGKKKTRDSLNGSGDVAFAPYLSYRNTLA